MFVKKNRQMKIKWNKINILWSHCEHGIGDGMLWYGSKYASSQKL